MSLEYRGYIIKPFAPVPNVYVVATAGRGGSIPKVLEGTFTSPTVAKTIIDIYEDSKETEEPKNDKKLVKRGV